MLILQRKKGESVVLDGNITVSILDVSAEGVKLAVEAPRDVTILRSELIKAAEVNKEAVADKNKIQMLRDMLDK